MLIPHLHFCDNCEEAIALYEKAFHTKAESIVYSHEYETIVSDGNDVPNESLDDHRIAHAVMAIHGQKVFLNDRFGNKDRSLNCAVHLIVMFPSVEELLASYEVLKEGSTVIDPFEKLPYSELSGNFIDKFGVQWGFMTE